MTVYTHSTYDASEQQPEETPQDSVRYASSVGTTHAVTLRDGVATTDNSTKGLRVLSSELNPHCGDGSVFATARNPRGFAVTEITPETLITVHGMQAPVKFFEEQGVIHRGADGRYAEGSGQPQGAEEETPPAPESRPDYLTMTTETAQSVDDALSEIPDHHIDPLAGLGVGVAIGELDVSVLEAHFSNYSGASTEVAASRVATMQAAYQQQADTAITGRCGIEAEDLGSFYVWARESQKGALREAVQKQIHSHDLSGYRALASRYLASNPPSLEAVKAGGYPVRQEGQQAEVFMDGRWLTIATAARLGLL